MFFQEEIETMPRERIREIQLERLKALVKRVYERVPVYKEKFDALGIKPEDIRTLDDIKLLPFTTKTDLRDHYPFGMFAANMRDVVRIHASSGTTGKPTVVGYTRHDLDVWSDCVARFCVAAGVTPDDVAQISFGYGLFTGALGLHQGLEKIGCAVIPMSSGNTEKQLMLMEDFGTTVLVATPTYAEYLSEVAHEKGIIDKLKLRVGLFGSESCTPEMRALIEKNFNVFATDNYGMSELIGPGVSGECQYRNGLHIAEDHFIVEIIDPETDEPVEDGKEGEVVVTTLSKDAFPMIRYRTHDISCLMPGDCPCGRTHRRMTKVLGRSDDMIIIKGVNVFPTQIESVLVKHADMGIGPHYQLILTKKNHMDALEVQVELVDASLLENYSALEHLQHSIIESLRSVLGLSCRVTLVSPNTIERFQGKAKRVIDRRNI